MSTTRTKSDVSAIGQVIDRAIRHLRHSRQLIAAQRRGDTVAQLEHSLYVADCEIASRMQLISLQDELTRQAQAEGLRLDDRGQFVPARA